MFKVFKSAPKEEELFEMPQEIEQITEERHEIEEHKLSLDEEVMHLLGRTFEIIGNKKPKVASGAIASPLCLLKQGEKTLSMWYRMQLRGETGVTHVPDFTIFRGMHRMSPREKNPDILIECRELPEDASNRVDPRVVKEIIGLSMDTLPAVSILVTNRTISPYAKALAKDYGIGVVEIDEKANPQHEIFRLLETGGQRTRETLLERIEDHTHKLSNLYRIGKKMAENASPELIKTGLREKVLKAMREKPTMTASQLSSRTGVHKDFILNELHKMEREGLLQHKPGKIQGVPEWSVARNE